MANKISVTIHYTEVTAKSDFPLSGNTLILADFYRKSGFKAELKGNKLTITSPLGIMWEYAISYELDGLDCSKDRDYARVFSVINNIINIRVYNTIRYINRCAW